MTSSLDNFALSFDSIKVDRATAPKTDAFDHAMAIAAPPAALDIDIAPSAAPQAEAPGFYLIDDAQGRFVIDQTSGVITLKDEAVLASEFGAVHEAHIKVVEISGAFYDMKFRLRLTGRVPQMQGSEENDALAALASAPIALLETATPEIVTPSAPMIVPETPALAWQSFSAAAGVTRKAPLHGETAPFGTLFAGPLLPECDVDAALDVEDTIPAPASAIAGWSLEARA
ncbi:hypothetical protein [Terricaulis sp.]|uniref:hypothetical protein n=1 Tax=Terricaulis sp. TaxID=2768686 RepID=UPI0037831DEB